MPLYAKCLTCGGWKPVPETPSAGDRIPTGMMMHMPQPPRNLCTCAADQDHPT